MREVIQIPEDVVNEIQMRDVEATGARDVFRLFCDMHALDEDDSFEQSPMYKAYKTIVDIKNTSFEDAKDKMIKQYIHENFKSWKLNYFTNELTIDVI